ncbi:MAG: hypothetical protein E4G90_11135 [Gemmatimonadales bacterium]|nr:MAG: hypothetical protein E4G90_11135 [Gemmatimonadales bacterium]
MKTGEVVGMAVFGFLVLGALVLAIRQGAKHREQVTRYSTSHGYPLLGEGDGRLAELLEEATPQETWSIHSLMLVDREPFRSYLFGYQARPKDRPSETSNGTGFLAEYDGRRADSPVTIFTRTPGVELLVDERVVVGVKEFGRRFTVTCASDRIATEVVNAEVQRTLLEFRENPGWYLSVTITARAVLVSSFWAGSEADWDVLVELGRKLRDSLR